MNETWKDVVGYEGSYMVSNLGRIKSLDRKAPHPKGGLKNIKGRSISLTEKENGYLFFLPFANGEKKMMYAHRAVAQAFIDNPGGFAEINHIDENKKNNRVDNLEWCDRKHNINHGTGIARATQKKSKRVKQIDRAGEIVAVWASARGCARATGLSQGNISSCCRGETETAYGHRWEYV